MRVCVVVCFALRVFVLYCFVCGVSYVCLIGCMIASLCLWFCVGLRRVVLCLRCVGACVVVVCDLMCFGLDLV